MSRTYAPGVHAINPTTLEPLGTAAPTSPEELALRIEAAVAAQRPWAARPVGERATALVRLAEGLREGRESSARLMAQEMGKPLAQGRTEVDKCALSLEQLASFGPAALADEPVATQATRSYVAYEPLGLVLAIMPWNYPFWQVVRSACPALLAGNAVLLKHAPNVPGCGERLQALFDAALGPSLLTHLRLDVPATSALIDHPAVSAVTLTGSTAAGRSVAARAGAALKKCVLELGGSDPYLVLEDAPLERAAALCSAARLVNGGQSCVAAKRFIVAGSQERCERFLELVVEQMGKARMGDPLEEGTDLGPLARLDLRDKVKQQVEQSVLAGARLRLGGSLPELRGAFYPATVLSDVQPGMPAFDEELFGPVAAVIRARDTEHAIELANQTSYGLGATVLSADVAAAEAIARSRLQAGMTFVNAQVHSDARLPFGGIKSSGMGRELGAHGVREFTNVKTVWVG